MSTRCAREAASISFVALMALKLGLGAFYSSHQTLMGAAFPHQIRFFSPFWLLFLLPFFASCCPLV